MFCSSCGGQVQDNAAVCPYCGQPLTVRPVQPAYNPVQPVNVATHMGLAILVTMCCCQPCGIVAIVYASQVSSMLNSGNVPGAQQASRNALIWAMVGLVFGFLGCVGYSLFWLASVL